MSIDKRILYDVQKTISQLHERQAKIYTLMAEQQTQLVNLEKSVSALIRGEEPQNTGIFGWLRGSSSSSSDNRNDLEKKNTNSSSAASTSTTNNTTSNTAYSASNTRNTPPLPPPPLQPVLIRKKKIDVSVAFTRSVPGGVDNFNNPVQYKRLHDVFDIARTNINQNDFDFQFGGYHLIDARIVNSTSNNFIIFARHHSGRRIEWGTLINNIQSCFPLASKKFVVLCFFKENINKEQLLRAADQIPTPEHNNLHPISPLQALMSLNVSQEHIVPAYIDENGFEFVDSIAAEIANFLKQNTV